MDNGSFKLNTLYKKSKLTHSFASFYVLQDFNLVKIFCRATHIFKILVTFF
jgi:hypothetical protein